MRDLEDMLGFRPNSFIYYMWCYVTPVILALLIVATIVQMVLHPAGYSAWVASEVSLCRCPALESSASVFILVHCTSFLVFQAVERFQSYPPWALAMKYLLMAVVILPLPIVFIIRHFNVSFKISGNLLGRHLRSSSA